MSRRVRALLVLAVLVTPASVLARPGTLDPTFGVGGRLLTASPIYALAIESDGSILASSDDGVTRYAPDGTPVATFGVDGRKILVLPDGTILLFRTSLGPLVRYTPDGILDPSFGDGGVIASLPLTFNPGAVAVQPDGKILVAGSAPLTLMRLLPDGSIDGGFGSGGVVLGPSANTEALVIEDDGAIVAGGHANTDAHPSHRADFVLTRFDVDGTLDPTFGVGGVAETDVFGDGGDEYMTSLLLQGDGIVAVGRTIDRSGPPGQYWFVAVRYVDGIVDPFFGVLGVAAVNFAAIGGGADETTYDADANVLIGGTVSLGGNPVVAEPLTTVRLESNGTLDAAFGTGGAALTPMAPVNVGLLGVVSALAVQTDGGIVAGGHVSATAPFRGVLVRYAGGVSVIS